MKLAMHRHRATAGPQAGDSNGLAHDIGEFRTVFRPDAVFSGAVAYCSENVPGAGRYGILPMAAVVLAC
jgi:hypothetical protein